MIHSSSPGNHQYHGIQRIVAVVGPTRLTYWMYCWVLIFALSPFYILIYMFKEMMHWVMGLLCKPNIYVSWSTSELKVWLAPPWNRFKPSSKIFLLTVQRRYFFCGPFVLFMSCVCHAFASVHCCLVATCWEIADLLALVCNVYCVILLLSHYFHYM